MNPIFQEIPPCAPLVINHTRTNLPLVKYGYTPRLVKLTDESYSTHAQAHLWNKISLNDDTKDEINQSCGITPKDIHEIILLELLHLFPSTVDKPIISCPSRKIEHSKKKFFFLKSPQPEDTADLLFIPPSKKMNYSQIQQFIEKLSSGSNCFVYVPDLMVPGTVDHIINIRSMFEQAYLLNPSCSSNTDPINYLILIGKSEQIITGDDIPTFLEYQREVKSRQYLALQDRKKYIDGKLFVGKQSVLLQEKQDEFLRNWLSALSIPIDISEIELVIPPKPAENYVY